MSFVTANAKKRISAEDAAWCEREKVYAITKADSVYFPDRLKIATAPDLLFVKVRRINTLRSYRFATITGNRRGSQFGRDMAEKITDLIAKSGYTILSGLSIGIDKLVVEQALKSGTAAVVLPGGLDKPHPPQHERLADRVYRDNGLLISEHPPNTPPTKQSVDNRARIQAGLADFSVIAEAGRQGVEAAFMRIARQQGRRVWVFLPDEAGDALDGGFNFAASKLLLKFGAKPFKTLEELKSLLSAGSLKASADEEALIAKNYEDSEKYHFALNPLGPP